MGRRLTSPLSTCRKLEVEIVKETTARRFPKRRPGEGQSGATAKTGWEERDGMRDGKKLRLTSSRKSGGVLRRSDKQRRAPSRSVAPSRKAMKATENRAAQTKRTTLLVPSQSWRSGEGKFHLISQEINRTVNHQRRDTASLPLLEDTVPI
jgi:hypothetical protein